MKIHIELIIAYCVFFYVF